MTETPGQHSLPAFGRRGKHAAAPRTNRRRQSEGCSTRMICGLSNKHGYLMALAASPKLPPGVGRIGQILANHAAKVSGHEEQKKSEQQSPQDIPVPRMRGLACKHCSDNLAKWVNRANGRVKGPSPEKIENRA
jgi:hypothetical protein